jgi:HAMP domain-containing protein
LGLVVPIKDGDEIIGILKCNLNILGSIDEFLSGAEDKLIGKFKLARSGGMVVCGDGAEPLSTQIPESILKHVESKSMEAIHYGDTEQEQLVGFSEINLTSGVTGYGFGGTFDSIDHKKGNMGESWVVFCYREMSDVKSSVNLMRRATLIMGMIIILVLAVVSLVFGRMVSRPLTVLIGATDKVRKGDYVSRIKISRKDEFGGLAKHFNEMVNSINDKNQALQEYGEELEDRVVKRTRELSESEEKYRTLFENMIDGFALHKIVVNKKNQPIDYVFIELNAAFEKQTGLKSDDIVGEKVTDVIPGIENDPADWISVWSQTNSVHLI